jgi:polyribonucleotide nucleotidyltransferase
VKVSRVDGELVVFPSLEQIEKADISLLLAGTEESLTMVEGGANEISEEDLISALTFGHSWIKKICQLQNELAGKIGKEKNVVETVDDSADIDLVLEKAGDRLRSAVLTSGKFERSAAIKELRNQVIDEIVGEDDPDGRIEELKSAFGSATKKFIRNMILTEGLRADGRKTDEIRPIVAAVDALPRTHGSAIFTRGETQALVTTTLGASKDEITLDKLEGRVTSNFMLHYNFPGFCVGEVKRMMGPSRREIGHGALAERALLPVIPAKEDFPYTIRIVSEILESNGSSSMASVCGGSLSLMDAGVPISNPVAGIAMGLVQDGDRLAVLSDILGLEDALGDMDFKVAGTKKGITAVQMDIKLKGGLSVDILQKALAQAGEGRMHILEKMGEAIEAPRGDLSKHAPRTHIIKVNQDKIGALIGPGGKVIKGIVADTGCQIDIADDGSVTIYSADKVKMDEAIAIVSAISQEAEVGKIYMGTVKRIVDFGAFIEIFPGTDGLCHISELADHRVNKVEDELTLDDEVLVKVINIDPSGKIRLSRKEAQGGGGSSDGGAPRRRPVPGGQDRRPGAVGCRGGRSR